MTFLQWLHGLFGHRWCYLADYCRDCGVSSLSVEERDWFKVIRLRGPQRHCWAIEIFEWRFGIERSPIVFHGEPYMTRYILYLGPINLRLHKFFRGDDDRASHTHPWWFITIPFAPYVEAVYKKGVRQRTRLVRAFVPQFRGRDFEHIVLHRVKWFAHTPDIWEQVPDKRPFWTFVIAGSKTQAWGFYPKPGVFVPWQEFHP